jgi:hypothetical protein
MPTIERGDMCRNKKSAPERKRIHLRVADAAAGVYWAKAAYSEEMSEERLSALMQARKEQRDARRELQEHVKHHGCKR